MPIQCDDKPMKPYKNIGGSILPSSCPQILRPIPFKAGLLQVIADEIADTHVLYFITGNDRKILASHPNGYSCHELAVRITKDKSKPDNRLSFLDQAEYIILCGGSVDFVAINSVRLSHLNP